MSPLLCAFSGLIALESAATCGAMDRVKAARFLIGDESDTIIRRLRTCCFPLSQQEPELASDFVLNPD